MSSRNQFEQWFLKQYEDNLYNTKLKWPPMFHKFLNRIRPREISGARRMNSFVGVKYNYPLTKAGYLCSVFSCTFKDIIEDKESKKDKINKSKNIKKKKFEEYETYYSYVYWPLDIKYVESKFNEDTDQHEFSTFHTKKKIMPEYICISPTYASKDGEFRGDGFVLWTSFIHGYEEHLELLSKVEEIIIALIEEKIISLDVTIYPTEKKDLIINEIDEQRLLIKIFAVSLLIDCYKLEHNASQIHTYPEYMKMISMIHKYTSIDNIIRSISYFTYNELMIFKTGKENSAYKPRCGQKIIPLTLKESTEVMNPIHKVWKEIYAQQLTTDLVINIISPSFSIYNSWTFIDNDGDPGFFEAEPMKKKYMDGLRSKLSIDTLKEARKKVPKGENNMPANYTYGQLSIKIYNVIEYGESLLLMSKLSICSLSEYVGYTIGSLPKLIRGLEFGPSSILNFFTDSKLFARHMFDWIYACHVLHTKSDIVHADLHLGNITFFQSAPATKVDTGDDNKIHVKPKFINPTIAYIIGDMGEFDTYIFPHYGNYTCLIDFSRCIFGKSAIQKISANRGKLFMENLFDSQVDTMIKLIGKFASKEYMERNTGNLRTLARTDPDKLFKLLSPIDFITFSRFMREHLKTEAAHYGQPLLSHEVRDFKVSDLAIKLIDNVYNTSLELFMKNLANAFPERKADIKQEKGTDLKDQVEFIGDKLMRKVFDEYNYTYLSEKDRQELDLLDIYNYNNEVKYSCLNYETWPDWAKAEKIRENLHGLKLTDVIERGPEPAHRPFQPNPLLDAIIERERLDTEDVPDLMRSSLLPE